MSTTTGRVVTSGYVLINDVSCIQCLWFCLWRQIPVTAVTFDFEFRMNVHIRAVIHLLIELNVSMNVDS